MIILGGRYGEALSVTGDFITVPQGKYLISFNEENRVLRVEEIFADGKVPVNTKRTKA